MAKQQQNWGAFVLEFLGSLVFLGVAFSGALDVSGAGFWGPIFVGAGVIASIALFFNSFGLVSGMGMGMDFRLMGLETSAVAGLTLTALTWTANGSVWPFAYWGAVLGFVLSFLGSWMAAKR